MVTVRTLHKSLAPWVALPFVVTALSGVAYHWGRHFFGYSKESAKWLMRIHQGSYLPTLSTTNTALSPSVVYTGFLGITALLLIYSGFKMIRLGFWSSQFTWFSCTTPPAPWSSPSAYRWFHHRLSSFIFAPVFLTVLSGFVYRWLRNVFGYDKEAVAWLLRVHQGAWIDDILFGNAVGDAPRMVFTLLYTVIVAFGVLAMAVSGTTMIAAVKRRLFGQSSNRHDNNTSIKNNSSNNNNNSNNDDDTDKDSGSTSPEKETSE